LSSISSVIVRMRASMALKAATSLGSKLSKMRRSSSSALGAT
jgi:hypothetical protein